jgi:hypothetical protein
MPYLYCQHCRLTIHQPRMFAMAASTCPRCKGELDLQPARLFDTPGSARRRRFDQPPAGGSRFSERPATSPDTPS